MTFDYAVMTHRNAGFVTEAEQARLRTTPVFVCGVGGKDGKQCKGVSPRDRFPDVHGWT